MKCAPSLQAYATGSRSTAPPPYTRGESIGARWGCKKEVGAEAEEWAATISALNRRPMLVKYGEMVTQFLLGSSKLAVSRACVAHRCVSKQIYRWEHMTYIEQFMGDGVVTFAFLTNEDLEKCNEVTASDL